MTKYADGAASRAEQMRVAANLRARGATWVVIAETLRLRFGLNGRAAMRIAHGWSQSDVATAWCGRWPNDRKTAKSISYWEQWPNTTGHAPSLDVLARLADLYECSLADLVTDLADHRERDRPVGTVAAAESAWPDKRSDVQPQDETSAPPTDWYVDALRSFVRLDLAQPEVLEERRIVSNVVGLDHLSTAITRSKATTASGGGRTSEAHMVYGGRLVPVTGLGAPDVWGIDLGRTLGPGERHEYAIAHVFHDRDAFAPYYVCRPFIRCDFFELRVQFLLAELPSRIEVLAGVTLQRLDSRPFGASDAAKLDAFGGIVVRFERLALGLAYGLRWLPSVD